MESYLIDAQRKLHVCGNNPDCAGYEVEEGSYRLKGYDGPLIECDKCGKPMQLKSGRFGKYFGCTGYPECKNTQDFKKGTWIELDGKPVLLHPEVPVPNGTRVK